MGRWGTRRAGRAAGSCAGLQADARQAQARGALQQARGRPGVLAATLPRGQLRHGASARCASGHERLGRGLGIGKAC